MRYFMLACTTFTICVLAYLSLSPERNIIWKALWGYPILSNIVMCADQDNKIILFELKGNTLVSTNNYGDYWIISKNTIFLNHRNVGR
jgi:hypothetical protein